jgi:hypothetical protein
MDIDTINWGLNWLWGMPLVVLTTVVHASALGVIGNQASKTLRRDQVGSHFSIASILVMGAAALSAIILHAFEAIIWAGAYLLLGAMHGIKSSMLYSMNAMTSYGHANLQLVPSWQMMGALEALNGWILFGLTTAFLFVLMQKTRLLT